MTIRYESKTRSVYTIFFDDDDDDDDGIVCFFTVHR